MSENQELPTSSSRKYPRRGLLKAAGGAAAGGALAAAGVKSGHALTQWSLASPMDGLITTSWHSGAIDVDADGVVGAPGSVYAYFRRSGAYGYIEPVWSDDSCDTPWNPSHQKLRFYCRTDGGQSYVGTAEAHHIYDISVSAGNLYACPRYICAQGPENNYVSDTCFTGTHVHYWANGAQYGTPSGTVVPDGTVFWTWYV